MSTRSIARRLAKLEALAKGPQLGHWRGGQWRVGAQFQPSIQVRYGNLRRLPEDYKGERHRELVRCFLGKDGRECVEYVEVPGPAPIEPPADPWLPTCIDVIYVEPYPSQRNAP
jgi:hypothetical protein